MGIIGLCKGTGDSGAFKAKFNKNSHKKKKSIPRNLYVRSVLIINKLKIVF